MSKKSKIVRPNRDPDHYSDRNVPYWWAPEWIRGTAADIIHDKPITYVSSKVTLIPMLDGGFVAPTANYMKIHAVKEKGDVNLYMKSKDGNLSYIKGRIQKQFKKWHEDRSIDYLLLGMDPDEIILDEED
jgi:hypothetical protein